MDSFATEHLTLRRGRHCPEEEMRGVKECDDLILVENEGRVGNGRRSVTAAIAERGRER